MVTAVWRLTFVVLMVKLTLMAPLGTTTLAGMLATKGLLLASFSVTPVLPDTLTVAVVLLPPVTTHLARGSGLSA